MNDSVKFSRSLVDRYLARPPLQYDKSDDEKRQRID